MIISKYLYSTRILKVQKRFTTAVVIVNTKYRIAVNLKKKGSSKFVFRNPGGVNSIQEKKKLKKDVHQSITFVTRKCLEQLFNNFL